MTPAVVGFDAVGIVAAIIRIKLDPVVPTTRAELAAEQRGGSFLGGVEEHLVTARLVGIEIRFADQRCSRGLNPRGRRPDLAFAFALLKIRT